MNDAGSAAGREGGRHSRLGTVGLVLSGGGGKGAYEVGCWRALRERGIAVDAVAGTSVGALNAALVAQGDLERAERLWSQITAKDVFKLTLRRLPALLLRLVLLPGLFYYRRSTAGKRGIDWLLLRGMLFVLVVVGGPTIVIALASGSADWSDVRGLLVYYLIMVLVVGVPVGGWFLIERLNLFVLDNRPLKETIVHHLDPVAVRESDVTTIVTAARGAELFDPEHPAYEMVEAGGNYYYFPHMSREYLPAYSRLNGKDSDAIVDLLLGSASLPFGIFPNRKLNDEGWLDGGLADNTPVLPLVDRGCETIVVVHLDHRLGRRGDSSHVDDVVGTRVAELEHKLAIEGESKENLRKFIALHGSKVELSDWPDLYADEPLPRRPLPKLVHIVPSRRLGGLLRGTLRFSPRRARWLMRLGYEDARRSLDSMGTELPGRRWPMAGRVGRIALLTVVICLGLLGFAFVADRIAHSGSIQANAAHPQLAGIGVALMVASGCLFWVGVLASQLQREDSDVPAVLGMAGGAGMVVGLGVGVHGTEGFSGDVITADAVFGAIAVAVVVLGLISRR